MSNHHNNKKEENTNKAQVTPPLSNTAIFIFSLSLNVMARSLAQKPFITTFF